MKGGIRWLVTYLAWFGAVIGAVAALAGAVNLQARLLLIGAVLVVPSVLWLRRLPSFTPRANGPGNDL